MGAKPAGPEELEMHDETDDNDEDIRPVHGAAWCAVWTHAHCEPLVHEQLIAKGFDAFLPTITAWSRRGGRRHLIQQPMFPGYLFLRHVIDKRSYVEILKTRGLARILGERWDRPALVADEEIEAIQRVIDAKLPVLSHPYLQAGQRVRITDGPLAEVEGLLVRVKPNKGLLVLSVGLLQRSVAVEVDCTLVAPTGPVVRASGAPYALAHS